MNSSGIKRGLAATAVAALAVTGLPFLASSASANAGGEMSVLFTGPVRNAGDVGGVIVLKTKDIDAAELDIANESLNGLPNNANQSASIVGTPYTLVGAAGNGYDITVVHVKATTTSPGGNVKYALYDDFDNGATVSTADVDAGEQRVQVSVTTAGAPASFAVTPASQSAASGVFSGDYVATLKDSEGRTTQLLAGETASITTAATTQLRFLNPLSVLSGSPSYATALTRGDDATLKADVPTAGDIADLPQTLAMGSVTFQANDNQAGPASVDMPLAAPGSITSNANLVVVATATNLDPSEVDIVTAADGWDGFDGGAFATTVPVRVDQASVTFDIDDDAVPAPDNKNKTVVLTATAGGAGAVKFGGKSSTNFTTVLGADGKGSITITPDAGTIVEGSTIQVTGSGIDVTLEFARTEVTTVATDAKTYVSKIGGSVDVTVTAKDQFGLPATGAYVGVQRKNGPNEDATETRKAVDANGKATFTLTDTKATALSPKDDVFVSAYSDQFANSATVVAADKADIVYSTTGQGADFAVSADNQPTASPVYDPTAAYATLPPLTDGVDSSDAEDVNIGIAGGTPGAPVTVSVVGGLVLPTGKTALADAKESVSESLDGTGAATFNVVGTKAGTATVTVTSGGRTKTAEVTVKALNPNDSTARNIAVSGPAQAKANDVVTFTAVVTDAFGNPVVGFDPSSGGVITTLTGPGQILSNSGKSNAAGQITYQVQLNNNAASPVALTVTGTGAQFGASANFVADVDDDAPGATPNGRGLSASSKTATASIDKVVNLAELQAAVDAAQDKVDVAQDNLDAAKGDLAVAKAERSVAQKAVKVAKKELRQAKKHHKGVKAARKALREARGDLRIAKAKVSVAQTKVNTANERLADAQAELEAAQQALEDAQA